MNGMGCEYCAWCTFPIGSLSHMDDLCRNCSILVNVMTMAYNAYWSYREDG